MEHWNDKNSNNHVLYARRIHRCDNSLFKILKNGRGLNKLKKLDLGKNGRPAGLA